LFNLDSERPQRIDRMHAVVARQKSAQAADAVGERGDNCGAMRNTFVARDSDFRLDPRRSFYAQLHKKIKEKRCRIQYLALSLGRNCRYGTRKILFVKGSLTSVPGGKPRTSTSPWSAAYGLFTKPGLPGTGVP